MSGLRKIDVAEVVNAVSVGGMLRGLFKLPWAAVTGKPSVNTTAPLAGGGSLATDLTLTTSIATGKIVGRSTAGAGVMEQLTPQAPLGVSAGAVTVATMTGDSGSGGARGVVPAPAAGDAAAGKYLGAGGTWGIPVGTGAPSTADYLVKTADAGLSAERVVTDTATVTWDWSTGGQAKANVAGVLVTAITGTASTTDATVTTCGTYTPTDLTTATLTVTVSAVKSSHDQGAGYVLVGTFRRSGGTVTQIGATTQVVVNEDDAAWDATMDVSGTSVRVRVTGKAATNINWTSSGTAQVAA